MTRNLSVLATTVASIACSALAACAGTPSAAPATTVASAAADCDALGVEIARAGEAQRAAAQQQHDAWKTPLPVVAVARFGQGLAVAEQSQRRQFDLRQQAARQGCEPQ